MLKTIFYFISTIILFFLIFNGLSAIREIEDEDEKHSALTAQLMLFIVWMLSSFLYFN